jgi:PIN domain nuclease of toxin-antitoxin system
MRYLLDTHALIWFINGDKDLSAKARKAIEADRAENFVSIASLWEMAIKISLERLDLKTNFEEVKQKVNNNNFQILPISFEDILKISDLPFHHRDPFDRMIIAQSLTNDLVIISKDKLFKEYPVKLIW